MTTTTAVPDNPFPRPDVKKYQHQFPVVDI